MRASRLLRRIPLGAFGMAAILAAAAGIVGYGLAEIVRGLDAGFIFPLALAGLLVGWLLSRSRLGAGWVLLILGLLGALLLVLTAGGLTSRLFDLIVGFGQDALRYRPWTASSPLEFPITQAAFERFSQGLLGVYSRFLNWFTAARTGEAQFDPLIPSFTWGWAVWTASGWAGWSTRRGYKPIAVFLPYLLIFGGSLGIVRENPVLLIPLMACLLFISPLVNHTNYEHGWQSRRVDYSLEIRFDLALSAIPLVMLILGLTALVFLIPWDQVFEPRAHQVASSAQTENMANSFGLTLPTRIPTVLDPYQAPGLPLSHLIGSGPELNRQVAMLVGVVSRTGVPPGAERPLYWRAFTYDRYLGDGWATNPVEIVNYSAGKLADAAPPPGSGQVSLQIRQTKSTDGILYYAGQLKAVNQSFTIQRRSAGDIFAGYLSQDQYQVESTLPEASPEQLRQAGKAYPEWVKNRYLALPENIPNRVVSLAIELTVAQGNAYDQAKAIESYLRKYPYTLDLPAPPQGRDIADYFLFDLKKGYCDYYATAMIVLARAAGLPARLVVGYASGQWDASSQEYIVHASDGHSWPEIYFPGYGWVEFEPTAGSQGQAGQFAEMQPPSYVLTPGASSSNGQGSAESQRFPWIGMLAVLPIVLALLGLRPLFQDRKVRRLSPATALSLIYRQLFREKVRLQLPSSPSQTPLELSEALNQKLGDLSRRRGMWKLFQPAGGEVQSLVDLYIQAIYSPREVSRDEFQKKFNLWQHLRIRLWVAGLFSGLKRQPGRK